MANSFNIIAGMYDRLARCIFGKDWKVVQLAPASYLQDKKEVLVVGGGTGKLLEAVHKESNFTFVELSPRMIRQAKNRKTSAQVSFIYADYLTWETDTKFDAILFPFFLDNFQLANLQVILTKAKHQLKPEGELHVVDFQQARPSKNFLVVLMYWFFRITARVEGRKLLNFDREIQVAGFTLKVNRTFYRDWIFYRIYYLRPAVNRSPSFSKDA